MATDIAFALAVLAIVGSDLPATVRSFLLTLAIVDDLGAILVIAVFFAGDPAWGWLLASLALVAVWGVLQHRRVTSPWLYVPLAIAAWWCMWRSGIHATVVGVALGVLVRATPDEDDDTLDRWQHRLEPWSAGLAVPVFALFAAGVHLTGDAVRALVTSPVALGIIAGLVLGKLGGVFAGAMTTGWATSATRSVSWRTVLGASQLAGIGFTVSLLLVELAFAGSPDRLAEGKAAVLTGSLLSALLGGAALRRRNRKAREARETSVATVSPAEDVTPAAPPQ